MALATNAAPVPMPISVNMFGLRLTNDAHIRSKNGAPHHSTTGIDRIDSIQFNEFGPMRRITAIPVAMSAIVNRNTGVANTRPIQKRRVMSASSGFGLSRSPMEMSSSIGSSAMPHLGHGPGRSDTTSGSIGQVH